MHDAILYDINEWSGNDKRGPVHIQFSDLWELATTGKLIRAPVAVLGKWKHPIYGDVEFDQQDFDQMQSNFSRNETGYEPPLFLGHPIDRDTAEGAPAEAHLVKLAQEDDVLFGLYEPTDEETLEAVEKGKFRYSSAELVREAKSKETGKNIGTLLVGCALTNRPFLTRMPRVEVVEQTFSDMTDESARCFVFPLKENFNDMATKEETKVPGSADGQDGANGATPEPTAAENDATKLSDQQEAEKATAPTDTESMKKTDEPDLSKLSDKSVDIAERFASLVTVIEQLRADNAAKDQKLADVTQRLELSEKRRQEEDLAGKLRTISKMNLSATVKEQYSALIKSGVLTAEAEDKTFEMLKGMAEENKTRFTTPIGVNDTVDEKGTNVALENNPYKDIIEANKKKGEELAEKRRNDRFLYTGA